VKITRNHYRQGSIRKVPRAKGFAWEYRYYVPSDGKRKLKMQTFNGKLYATEADVRRAVGVMVPGLNDGTVYSPSLAGTFGALLDRYIAEEMPSRKSSRDSYLSIIKNHLRPRWENMVLSDIKPALIHTWFQSLKLQSVSKGHVRSLMRRLFELATLWKYLPIERRNPVEIVKIKGVTKRAKEPVVITHELNRLNIEFISFSEQIDTGGPLGRAIMAIVGAVAELERSLIIERVRAGMRRAKFEGRHIGRKALELDRAAIFRDLQNGQSLGQLAKRYLVSRTTVHRVLGERIPAVTEGVEKVAA
jgi:hypothetical protein